MMDEPMEEDNSDVCDANSNQKHQRNGMMQDGTVSQPSEQPKNCTTDDSGEMTKLSILKPGSGSMMMMKISEEDYESHYWPRLENAINQLLTMVPGEYIPISYEQMYSCVYKCVCKQFSERLYNDLCHKISSFLIQVSQEIQNSAKDSRTYIEKFHNSLNQYFKALSGIVPIFNYMNRFYVESKLRTDLDVELRKLFTENVAEKHVPVLVPLIIDAMSAPFAFPPPMMASLIKNIYSLKPEFAQLRPHLFAKYIPNVMPPTTESDLSKLIEETKRMQRDLQTHPLFMSGDQSKKRTIEDDKVRLDVSHMS